ncbi:MAG: acyl carrier protein [Candidatus Omnitrophota bacterium]
MSKITGNLEDEIRSLIAEIIEVEPSKIKLDTHLVNDLGIDSMMALEILAAVEKKYKVKIPEGYLPKMTSLAGAVEVAKEMMSVK